MTTYYSLNPDGTIRHFTNSAKRARECGFTLKTERKIVMGWNGEWYFQGEEPEHPATFADYDSAMEAHLAAERMARGYTSREPSDYAGSSNPRWAQDAADWIAHRDAVMEYGLEVENRAKTGGDVPTLEEFKAALPKITWTFGEGEGGTDE